MADHQDSRTFIYRIDAGNVLIFLNQAWLDFAQENQAPGLTAEHVLGQPLDRFIAGWETRHLYELVYHSVRRRRRAVRLHFACDSPTLRRSFRMHLTPLERGILEFTVEVLHVQPLPAQPLLDPRLPRSAEIVVICSWCKRIRLDDLRWVGIENVTERRELFGATPPSLTHDVCPDCFAAIRRQIDCP